MNKQENTKSDLKYTFIDKVCSKSLTLETTNNYVPSILNDLHIVSINNIRLSSSNSQDRSH